MLFKFLVEIKLTDTKLTTQLKDTTEESLKKKRGSKSFHNCFLCLWLLLCPLLSLKVVFLCVYKCAIK